MMESQNMGLHREGWNWLKGLPLIMLKYYKASLVLKVLMYFILAKCISLAYIMLTEEHVEVCACVISFWCILIISV